jgi:integrase
MAHRLTELAIQKAKPPASGQIEIWDGTVPGLGLRVTSAGTKSWVLLYRIGGRARRLTLGRWPGIGLAGARKAAWDARRLVGEGKDPAVLRAAAARDASRDPFENVVAEFIEKYAKPKNRSWRETERLLRRELVPRWRGRPIATLTRGDIGDALDQIVARGAPVIANRTLAALRKLLNWCVERGKMGSSPAAGINAPARVISRDRVLDDGELAAIWWASGDLGWPWAPFLRLLIVTAQRREEVAHMAWPDVSLERRLWILPRELTKADRAHEVPLSDLALEIIDGLPRMGDRWVFPARRRVSTNPVSGFSKMKRRLDELSGVTDWRLHDIRRTAASGMARLGHPPHVVAAVLNHSPGSTQGITAVYNRHRYSGEKRVALEAWGRELLHGLGGKAPEVVELRIRR